MPKKGGKATPKQLEALRKGREKLCAKMAGAQPPAPARAPANETREARTRSVLENAQRTLDRVRDRQQQEVRGRPRTGGIDTANIIEGPRTRSRRR